MKIEGHLEIRGFTRIQDIDSGECFQFLDDKTLYMRCDDFYVAVSNGMVYEGVYENDRPIREVKTRLIIEN